MKENKQTYSALYPLEIYLNIYDVSTSLNLGSNLVLMAQHVLKETIIKPDAVQISIIDTAFLFIHDGPGLYWGVSQERRNILQLHEMLDSDLRK